MYRRYIIRSPECHSVNALVFEVLAQRQHVRVVRPTLEAFNQEQSLTAVHSWPLLDLGRRLERLRFPCRIVHQRRDFDHVTVRYLRLMRLVKAIERADALRRPCGERTEKQVSRHYEKLTSPPVRDIDFTPPEVVFYAKVCGRQSDALNHGTPLPGKYLWLLLSIWEQQ